LIRFPSQESFPKIVRAKGKLEVVSLTDVERGGNVTVVACFSAMGTYVTPVMILNGIRRPEFEDELPPGSSVGMSDSGWNNEDLFLAWLEHFLTFKSEGRILLISDNRGRRNYYEVIRFCKECKIWYHELCIGAFSKKTFTYGKCV
jgi:hypothetical protein